MLLATPLRRIQDISNGFIRIDDEVGAIFADLVPNDSAIHLADVFQLYQALLQADDLGKKEESSEWKIFLWSLNCLFTLPSMFETRCLVQAIHVLDVVMGPTGSFKDHPRVGSHPHTQPTAFQIVHYLKHQRKDTSSWMNQRIATKNQICPEWNSVSFLEYFFFQYISDSKWHQWLRSVWRSRRCQNWRFLNALRPQWHPSHGCKEPARSQGTSQRTCRTVVSAWGACWVDRARQSVEWWLVCWAVRVTFRTWLPEIKTVSSLHMLFLHSRFIC